MRLLRAVAALCLFAGIALPASALIFASPDTEPTEIVPPDFPYWEHITQRRYEGPSVVYLGAGFALTARHVGMGEIFLEDKIFEPIRGSNHSLLNPNGSPADAIIFELDRDVPTPDWPLVPIAEHPPMLGEDVLLVGFGKGRERVIQFDVDGDTQFSFKWSQEGTKRWATNRVSSPRQILDQGKLTSRAFTFDFDAPFAVNSTRYEAQAAVGDSGGGVFVRRGGEWRLVGLMVSVSGRTRAPDAGSMYGDLTYAIDLTHYRDQIIRWSRTACSNELDDDNDGTIDFPADPGCDSREDRNERDVGPSPFGTLAIALSAVLGIVLVLFLAWRRAAAQRGTSTPSSTSPSIDA